MGRAKSEKIGNGVGQKGCGGRSLYDIVRTLAFIILSKMGGPW